MKNKRISVLLIILAVLIPSILLTGCKTAEEVNEVTTELINTRLPMGYIPDIQQAPVYVADMNQYFEATGYNFEFDYSWETDGIALVAAGEVPFAFGSGEQVLLAREQGMDVVYVLAWYQDYPVAIVALEESGIQTIEDLEDKKVGVPGAYGANYIALKALLENQNMTENDIQLESIGYNQTEALVSGVVDAASVYINNTPVQLRNQGYEIITFPVSDYINLASNGLITSQKFIYENPETVEAMVNAMINGISETIADPEKAFEISKSYVETLATSDETVQKEVLAESIKLWDVETIGWIESESWENMMNVLIKMDLLTEEVDLDKAYTNEFIK